MLFGLIPTIKVDVIILYYYNTMHVAYQFLDNLRDVHIDMSDIVLT